MKWSRIAIIITCLACIAIALKIDKLQKGRIIHYPVPSTQGAKTIRMWIPHYLLVGQPRSFVDDGKLFQPLGENVDPGGGIITLEFVYMPNKEGWSLQQCADFLHQHWFKGELIRDIELPSKPGMQIMQEETRFHEFTRKIAYLYDLQTHCCYALEVVAAKEARWGDIDRMQASLSLESGPINP